MARVETPINAMSLVEAERSLLLQIQEQRLRERKLQVHDVLSLNEDQVHKLTMEILIGNENVMETVGRINWLIENNRV